MDERLWIGIVFVGVLLFWVVASAIEARTFERLTGTEVSTFEAMFVNLRIDGCELRRRHEATQ